MTMNACTIENKLHDLVPQMPEGECDLNNPSQSGEEFLPIAICSASNSPVSPLREGVDILGEESYDPNGYEIIDYHWKLVERPEGSMTSLGVGEANRYDFVPDVVGTYLMELTVTNELCLQSSPCQVELEAIPDGDLWVEMYWKFPNDDMDLHLTMNNAAYLSEGDCYYGNCVTSDGFSMLDWGSPGETDDPHLDLDDIERVGPENINIESPAAGTYQVVVHDYPGSVYEAANEVTVRIHLGGEMVYEETKSIEGEDSYVVFADIDWPSGTITPM
jgi:hypothetical protein